MPDIETERLMLRQPTIAHLHDWVEHVFADPEVIRYMPQRDMMPYELAERALILCSNFWAQHKVGGWVITDKVDGQFIGSCEIEYLDETRDPRPTGRPLSSLRPGSVTRRFHGQHAVYEPAGRRQGRRCDLGLIAV